MKIISRRQKKAPTLEDGRILLRTIRSLRGDALVPRGVYRFKTFQEADEWMMQQMVRTRVVLK